MAKIKLYQGDSFVVYVELLQEGNPLTHSYVADIEICLDETTVRKTLSGGDLSYDKTEGKWAFRLSQEETFALEPDAYTVEARVKFHDGSVLGLMLGTLDVRDIHSEEVL